MPPKNLTQIPLSHRNEWKSKRKFEEIIEPWYMPFDWSVRDYGIDGQVEIAKQISDTGDLHPESKFFFVQLKCIESLDLSKKYFSFPIPVKKISQWYSANLPFLLTVYHNSNNKFYYLWIDDNLISTLDNHNPHWISKESITLKIPVVNIIVPALLPSLREYVLNWKAPLKKIITPGLYFELKSKCEHLSQSFLNLSAPFELRSINERSILIAQQINEAIYRLAITGPSRSGKSSLINAMLGKQDISPTGLFQTTGVSIQVIPGTNEQVTILFKDGKSEKHKFSPAIIKKFASQDENINNSKSVSLVTITIRNAQLEKGISFFDIPGLDDPEEKIYEHAWYMVQKSNAIFYLLDAAVMEHGGFVFRNEFKRHILDLSSSLDKIFLVFNKIDALSAQKLEMLKEKVVSDLKRLNLFDKIAGKIYYVSTLERGKFKQGRKKTNDSLSILENDLWQYILTENKIGLSRLNDSVENIDILLKDFHGLLQARLLNIETQNKLRAAVTEVERRIPSLTKTFYEECANAAASLKTHIENRKNKILDELEEYLTKIPPAANLPDKQILKNHLSASAKATVDSATGLYYSSLSSLNNIVNLWIENNLQRIRDIINSGTNETKMLRFDEFESIEIPDADISNSVGVGLFTGLISWAMFPGVAVAAAFAGFFSNLVLTAEEIRAKRIKKIMSNVRRLSDHALLKVETAFLESYSLQTEIIRHHINKHLDLYFEDISKQLKKNNVAGNAVKAKNYKQTFAKIAEMKTQIHELNKELVSWRSRI